MATRKLENAHTACVIFPFFFHSVVGHLFPGFGYCGLHCKHSYVSFCGHKPITSSGGVFNSETAGP